MKLRLIVAALIFGLLLAPSVFARSLELGPKVADVSDWPVQELVIFDDNKGQVWKVWYDGLCYDEITSIWHTREGAFPSSQYVEILRGPDAKGEILIRVHAVISADTTLFSQDSYVVETSRDGLGYMLDLFDTQCE